MPVDFGAGLAPIRRGVFCIDIILPGVNNPIMMSRIASFALMGIDALPIDVEVDISNGRFNFAVVGLPDAGLKESRERIQSAIQNSGFYFPDTRTVVNLAPADIKKEGALLDLPIAHSIDPAIPGAPSPSNT